MLIDPAGVASQRIAEAQKFYDAAFAALGGRAPIVVPREFAGGRIVVGYGRDRPQFWLHEGEAGPGRRVAFTARNRAEVDAFHKAAMAAGGARQRRAGPPTAVSSRLPWRLRAGPRWQQHRGRVPRSDMTTKVP